MTPALWVTLAVGLLALAGTILTVSAALRNNRETLEVKWRELAASQEEKDEARRQSEQSENLAEARRLRDEVRAERDRIAKEVAEKAKEVAAETEHAALERYEFRQEIAILQGRQRTFDQDMEAERARHAEIVATLTAQHAEEMVALRKNHKEELAKLTRKILTMEARIRELEKTP